METRDVLIILAVAVAFIVGFSLGGMFSGGMSEVRFEQFRAEYRSNGEMIFMTGVNERGERIPFVGGPQWLQMHGGGCASCHGVDGRGGIYPMMCGVETPDIRYSTLAEEHGMSEEDIKRAITAGIGEDGELNYCMPRWQMSEKDLNDLIEFSKQLK